MRSLEDDFEVKIVFEVLGHLDVHYVDIRDGVIHHFMHAYLSESILQPITILLEERKS